MSLKFTFWIFQTGEPLHCDIENRRPMRAINLSNKLIEAGHNVVLWSSAFDHQNKNHRTKEYKIININKNLEIRLIPSFGYTKHIGFRRLLDHLHMAWNLKKILAREESLPDVAFIGYPPIETAAVLAKWLKSRKIPMILDIKDLWPSIFVDAFPKLFKPVAIIVFYPFFMVAKKLLTDVSAISSMSESFLNWSYDFANRIPNENDRIVRLTSINNEIDNKSLEFAKKWWYAKGVVKNIPKVFFVGTFSTAFDFDEIYNAAYSLPKCQFVLCGHGPCLDEVKKKMSSLNNVIFPGWIDTVKMQSLAKMSVATIAPYRNTQNFTLNIPNKIVDSLLMGLPILCPLRGEVLDLIQKHRVGLTYNEEFSLKKCIQTLIEDKRLQKKISINARKLYDDEFEFNKVYDGLVFQLERMAINE